MGVGRWREGWDCQSAGGSNTDADSITMVPKSAGGAGLAGGVVVTSGN